MKPFIGSPFLLEIGTELIYSFVIIISSLMIYFGTREIYELSSHKGIKYFRQAFLFFAIAYVFRSLIKFILIFFNIKGIVEYSPMFFGIFTLFLFMYFSSIAIFYLLYSIMWKKWKDKLNIIYLFHSLAFIIAIISIILRRSILLHLCLTIFLFVFITIVVYIAYQNSKKRKKHKLYIIYLLLSIFLILNIIDILIPNFVQPLQLFIYMASLGIFLLILYKVLKKVGSD